MYKTFMKKENRDKLYYQLKTQGVVCKRSSSKNQLFHPMYVSDYEAETGHILTAAEKGFGNSIYKTYFSVLYTLTDR